MAPSSVLPANHQSAYPNRSNGTTKFCLCITHLKKTMNLQNSHAEVGHLQSNKYKNHIPCDVNDPPGALESCIIFYFGLIFVKNKDGLNRTSKYANYYISQIFIEGIFWIYPPTSMPVANEGLVRDPLRKHVILVG